VFSLALVIDHEPVIGVVAEPQTDTLFWAVKGEGAYQSDDEGDGPSRLQVTEHALMRGASLSLPGSPNDQIDSASLIKDCLDKGAEMVTTGSAVYDAVRVATGFVSADVYPYVSCWDMAAAALIVREAGGKATDLHGQPLQLDKQIAGAVLSNGHLHDELLSIIGPLIKK
jgi:fructose-1,6-bisphosphatase/inositol monophosphatase family enzyme